MARKDDLPKILKPLLYRKAHEWAILPNWTEGYREIGSYFSKQVSSGKILTLVMVVPTRSFVASMICLGIIQSYLDTDEADDHVDHIQRLKKLSKNSPLILQQHEKVQRVFLDSIIEEKDGIFFKVLAKNKKGNMSPLYQLIPERNASLLKSLGDDQTKPTSKNVGKELYCDFLFEYLGTEKALDQIMKADLDCKIIGIHRFLKKEICETEIGFRKLTNVRKGSLNDMLLVKQFVGDNDVFLSQVIKCSKGTDVGSSEKKRIILFDGPKAFLENKMYYAGNPSIIILDRTDKSFNEAIQIVNQDIHRSENWLDMTSLGSFFPPASRRACLR